MTSSPTAQARQATKIEIRGQNLNYTVTSPDGDAKQIIRNVTMSAQPGRVLAIMGPSGAGKTTLANILAGRITTGGNCRLDGDILLNRRKAKPITLRKVFSVVTQEDTVYETATPREIVTFGLRMRAEKGTKKDDIDRNVNSVLKRLRLNECADTIVGIPGLLRGISGGERKRTNIASELIGDPSVLLLDEPTTGLDSVNALQLMILLKELARNEGRTIILSVHQPSSEIYELFDDLLLLSNGRIVYNGPAQDAVDYFASIGHPCPPHYNPSDFFMAAVETDQEREHALAPPVHKVQRSLLDRITGKKHAAPAAVLKPAMSPDGSMSLLGDLWAHKTRPDIIANPDPVGEEDGVIRQKASPGDQMAALMTRSFKHVIRNKMQTQATIGQAVFFMIVLLLLYVRIGKTQQSIQDRQGFLFTVAMNIIFSSVFSTTLTFVRERPVFIREQSSALYSAYLYFFAKYIVESPITLIVQAIFIAITFWASGVTTSATAFFICMGVLLMAVMVGRSIGMLMSAIAPNIQAAIAMTPMVIVPMIFGGGLVASNERLKGFWYWLRYYSVMRYPYIVSAKAVFEREKCFTCSEQLNACDAGVVNRCSLGDGPKVLRYFDLQDEHMWLQFLILGAIWVLTAILAIVVLHRLGSKTRA